MQELLVKLLCWFGLHHWLDIGVQTAEYRQFWTDGHVQICRREGCPTARIIPLNLNQHIVEVCLD